MIAKKSSNVSLSQVLLLITLLTSAAFAQNGLSLFGDVKINGAEAPPTVTVILYKDVGGEVGRLVVSNGSRYRFNNLLKGDYELAIESDNNEIARLRIVIGGLSNSPYGFQQDLEFEWKPNKVRAGLVSATDLYNRPSATNAIFAKAQLAAEKKKTDEAIKLLKQVVEQDKADFQAWTILGSLYLSKNDADNAERAYRSAIEARPTFAMAFVDLGRLLSSQKKYADAIDPLTHAIEIQPNSGEANMLLGECYLQVKKGSKAIPYLEAASRLDHPEAHLRLGWLYNAAGLKDKAALEYEEFLKKKPDYQDRNRLLEYIKANHSPNN